MDLWSIFLKEEFIPNFEVSTTSTAANHNSQFQAEEITSSEKTCIEELDQKEGEKENRQSALTMFKEMIFAALQADYKPQVIHWNRFSNYNKL